VSRYERHLLVFEGTTDCSLYWAIIEILDDGLYRAHCSQGLLPEDMVTGEWENGISLIGDEVVHRQPLKEEEAASILFQIKADPTSIIWSKEEMNEVFKEHYSYPSISSEY